VEDARHEFWLLIKSLFQTTAYSRLKRVQPGGQIIGLCVLACNGKMAGHLCRERQLGMSPVCGMFNMKVFSNVIYKKGALDLCLPWHQFKGSKPTRIVMANT
jgi:hypothetical protein